jgi:hypothetical protein
MVDSWMDETCPCCGYKTITADYEICQICGWEYDSHGQNLDPDEGGGPNRATLREAQQNFISFGASSREMLASVRAPTCSDRKDPDWRALAPVAARSP